MKLARAGVFAATLAAEDDNDLVAGCEIVPEPEIEWFLHDHLDLDPYSGLPWGE